MSRRTKSEMRPQLAVAGWLRWHGKPSKDSEASAPSIPPAEAVAGDASWPGNLAELNRWYAEPPAGQNAAQVFIQGFDAMDGQFRAHGTTNNVNLPLVGKAALPLPASPVPAAMKTAMAELMRQNKSALDLFQQASSLPQSRYPIDLTKGYAALFPDLARAKQAAQLSATFALGQAGLHRGQEAGESLLTGYGIGRSLETEIKEKT
jgi:hypothetical protein